ncbi:acyl-CoA dehydrogenase family protein [Sulfitobacter porphyrae]|uniref:Acyl-CoA dehydrogenase family protein n=1 Tax=Sulfitobacter porphyrae TaxID=1246864 RepID=A0ABW2BCU4_9RHOB
MFKTEEQIMACDSLRRFLDDQIEPEYLKVKDAPFEKEVIQGFMTRLAEFGLTSAPHPEEAGGMGLDWTTHLMLFEEVGVTAIEIALPILINVVAGEILLKLGSDEIAKNISVRCLPVKLPRRWAYRNQMSGPMWPRSKPERGGTAMTG